MKLPSRFLERDIAAGAFRAFFCFLFFLALSTTKLSAISITFSIRLLSRLEIQNRKMCKKKCVSWVKSPFKYKHKIYKKELIVMQKKQIKKSQYF